MKKCKLSVQDWTAIAQAIIAVAAVGIAVIAIVFTVQQNAEARRHNRLSVKPAIAFSSHKVQDDKPIGLYLKNHGAGPAFFQKLTIWVDSEPIDTVLHGGWMEAALQMGIVKIPFRTGSVTPKSILASGDERLLFGIEPKDQTPENVNHFLQAIALHNLKVEVTYTSLYDESFTESVEHRQVTEEMLVPKESIEELLEPQTGVQNGRQGGPPEADL